MDPTDARPVATLNLSTGKVEFNRKNAIYAVLFVLGTLLRTD